MPKPDHAEIIRLRTMPNVPLMLSMLMDVHGATLADECLGEVAEVVEIAIDRLIAIRQVALIAMVEADSSQAALAG
ncbi:MAG: hypothetical protein R3D33_14880 [Hyphomicrobiaceae bacterium]